MASKVEDMVGKGNDGAEVGVPAVAKANDFAADTIFG